VLLLAFGTVFPVAGSPGQLWWLFGIPLVALAWVLRTQTTITPDALLLRGLLRSRHVAWSQVEGVRFPHRGFACALLVDGGELTLPAVTFERLPELAAHSHGRIPDPFALPQQEDLP
jgi:hypothetical protein